MNLLNDHQSETITIKTANNTHNKNFKILMARSGQQTNNERHHTIWGKRAVVKRADFTTTDSCKDEEEHFEIDHSQLK